MGSTPTYGKKININNIYFQEKVPGSNPTIAIFFSYFFNAVLYSIVTALALKFPNDGLW